MLPKPGSTGQLGVAEAAPGSSAPSAAQGREPSVAELPGDQQEGGTPIGRVATSLNDPTSGRELSDVRELSGERELSGVIAVRTLLIIDLVDSTRLVEMLGDARADQVFANHDRMARVLLAEHGGREIDKTDGFLHLFERPLDALSYALQYQSRLAQLSSEQGVDLRARVGIHVGELVLRENSPEDVARGAKPLEAEGLAKLMTARVMSAGAGRQILLTKSAFELAQRASADHEVVPGLRWLSHGDYRLQGMQEPVGLYEVGVEGFAPLSPPPGGAKARPVRPRKTLALLVALLALVLTAAVLVKQPWQTTPGPPPTAGTGAFERVTVAVLGFRNLGRSEEAWYATALSELFTSELAAGEDLRLISGEIVSRMRRDLDLTSVETLSSDTLRRVRKYLNTDYVLVGSYLALPRSEDQRIRLSVALQHTLNEDPVGVGNETGGRDQLFELVSRIGQQVRLQLGTDELTQQQREAVRNTLSAVPAATRYYSQGLEALRRHDTLAAKDLLLQAVETDPQYALAHAALAEAWLSLGHDSEAEQSARQAMELGKDLPREEYLSLQGRYYEASARWVDAVDTYRVLWGFFPDDLDHGVRLARAQISAAEAQAARNTVQALRRLPAPLASDPRIDLLDAQVFYLLSDSRSAVLAAQQAADKGRQLEAHGVLAEALLEQGFGLLMEGRRQEATAAFDEALELFVEVGDRRKEAEVLNGIGYLAQRRGETGRAEQIYRRTLEMHRTTGNRRMMSTMMLNVAGMQRIKGDLDKARQLLEDSVELARQVGDRRREAVSLDVLAWVRLDQGEPAEAQELAEESWAIFDQIGKRWNLAWDAIVLGHIHRAMSNLAEAAAYYRKAVDLCAEIDEPSVAGHALRGEAEVLRLRGDLALARERLEQARSTQEQLGEEGHLAETQLAEARLALAEDRLQDVAPLVRQATQLFDREERGDDAARAALLLAWAHLRQGENEAAEQLYARLTPTLEQTQNPDLRLRGEAMGAQLQAEQGSLEEALKRLREAEAEAQRRSLVTLQLELQLRHAALQLLHGQPEIGNAALRSLIREARDQGQGGLANSAEQMLLSAPAHH